jgi:hypothetical protein
VVSLDYVHALDGYGADPTIKAGVCALGSVIEAAPLGGARRVVVEQLPARCALIRLYVLAAVPIARWRFQLAHGESGSGFTERYVGRLHQLRGEWADAIPSLLAARPRMQAEDLVACDQALVASYIRLGRTAEALALCEEGIRSSGRFATIYQRLREQVQQGK